MAKELESSYRITDEETGQMQDQGSASSYFTNTFRAIKSLGITSVRDVPHDKSDTPSTDLLDALVDTQEWLDYKAYSYAKKNDDFHGNLEALLKKDPLAQAARTHEWCGLYQPEDKDSREHYQYVAFSVFWQFEKINKFKELVQQYWKEKKQQQPKPKPKKSSWRFYLIPGSIILVGAGIVGYLEHRINRMNENIDTKIEMTTNVVDYRLNNKFKDEKEKLIKEFWEIHYPKIKNDQREDQLQYLTDFVENTPLPKKWKEDLKKTISEAVDQMWEQKKKELFGED